MKVYATLFVKVLIDQAENCKEVENQLLWAADQMAAKGMLTGEGLNLLEWESKVYTSEKS